MQPGGIGANSPGAVRVAKIKRYYIDGVLGIPLCDVVMPNGTPYFGVRVISTSGGSESSFELHPPPVWEAGQEIQDCADVLVATGGGSAPAAYVLGTAYTPGLDQQVTGDATDFGADRDYSSKVHYRDKVVKHGDVRVVLGHTGTWLVDLTQTGQPARIQLGPDAFLRISASGEAEECVLLGVATLKHLRSIHQRLDDLAAKIDAVEAHAKAVGTSWQTASTTLSGAVGAVVPAVIPYVDVPVPSAVDPWDFGKSADISHATDGGSSDLLAGCFRISSRTKHQQET